MQKGPFGKGSAGGVTSRFDTRISMLAASASPVTVYLLAMGLAAQTFHMVEHFGQLYEHLPIPIGLGWTIKQSAGIIYFLNLEWNHWAFNTLYLILLAYVFLALRFYSKDSTARQIKWAFWAFTVGFAIQIWHEVEHTVRIDQFLTTGCTPCKGVLGNYFDGIYLHFTLNSLVYLFPLVAFLGYGFHRRIRASYSNSALGLASPAEATTRRLPRVNLSLTRATVLFFSAYLLVGATLLQLFHMVTDIPQLSQHAFLGLSITGSQWTDSTFDLTYLFVIGVIFISLRLFLVEGLTGWKKFAAYAFGVSFFTGVYLVTDDLVRILQYTTTKCTSCYGILGFYLDPAYQHFVLNLVVFVGPIAALLAFKYYSLLTPKIIQENPNESPVRTKRASKGKSKGSPALPTS